MQKYFYNTFLSCLIGLFTLFLVSSLGFIFNFSINPSYFYISILVSILILVIKSKTYDEFIKQFFIIFIIFISSFIISNAFIDVSWDGRFYHYTTALLLKLGWNPIYDNIYSFAPKVGIFHNYPWIESYPKFTEIIMANLYSLKISSMDSIKQINFILMAISFMYSYWVLSLAFFEKKSKLFNFFTSFLLVYNPIVICQILTLCNDLILYFNFLILILTIIYIEKTKNKNEITLQNKNFHNIEIWTIFIISSIFLASTKFTGALYLAIIYFCYFIYLIILKSKLKSFILSILITSITLFITNINPYITNIINHSHPFYPVFGQEKFDLMANSFPNGFNNKNRFYKFFISTFSQSDNILKKHTQKKATLKIPFTIKADKPFFTESMRIAGFGYFFSGILLLSIFFSFGLKFNNKNNKYLLLLIISIITLTILSNPESWWARFIPQFWILPIFIVYFSFIEDNKLLTPNKFIKASILYITLLIIFINSFIVNYQNLISSINYSSTFFEYYSTFNKIYPKGIELYQDQHFYIEVDETVIPRLKEFNVKYELIDDNSFTKNKSEFVLFNETLLIGPHYFWRPKK